MMKIPEKDKSTGKLPKYLANFARIWQNLKLQGGQLPPLPPCLVRLCLDKSETIGEILADLIELSDEELGNVALLGLETNPSGQLEINQSEETNLEEDVTLLVSSSAVSW